MDTLIIAEKPSVALRLAIALGDNRQKRQNLNGVGYYQIDGPEGTLYIAPAVGHVYTLAQADSERGYPVLNVKWVPSYESSPGSAFTKKYLDVLMLLGRRAAAHVNACDFDTEGTVIGTNIIRNISGEAIKSAKRMKFSTTTIPDIKRAYANLMPLDMNNFYAGEARHMLDWLWGINLSRALTSAMAGTTTKALSIGRVQGPTLAVLAKREKEIEAFRPKPFWRIFINAKSTEFLNSRGDIFDRADAQSAHDSTKGRLADATVEEVEEHEQLSRPYPPFDLTSLQLEASRALRIDPSTTLAIAQSLYERSYISYPRTASQKLPPTLGLQKIIGELAKNPVYEKRARRLIEEKRFRPSEGMKSDEAHPAIYPTGVAPKEVSPQEAKLYDLIAQRFLSCFAPYARLAKSRVVIRIGEERYSANGTKIVEKGWTDFYSYARLVDKELPQFTKGERAQVSGPEMRELETQPPKRFGKAALLSELEKKDLGTKATRASIIDTLFKRAYIDGSPITVTRFGMSVYEALHENAGMILDEGTTRKLESDMEEISQGKRSEEAVIEEGKSMLLDALKLFDSNKEKISEAMRRGLSDSIVPLGKCPEDGGELVIRRSRAGKQFVACANYPKCTKTFSLPQGAKIVPTGKSCEHCHTPIIKVIRRGKGVFEMDLDPNCVSKAGWKSNRDKAETVQGAPAKAAPAAPDKPAKAAEKPSRKAKAAGAKPAAKKRAARGQKAKPAAE